MCSSDLVWVGVVAGAAMAIGLAAGFATRVAFAVVTYLLVLDINAFSHNRAFLVWLLFGLCLVPSGITLRPARHPSSAESPGLVGPLWPITLLRVVVSGVYLTSGLTKLANRDWRSGLVLWDRVNRHQNLIPFDGWLRDVITSRAFHHVVSPASIALEVGVGVALWFPRTRLAAVWVAFVFHASIEVTASVQTFSYSAIAALLLWVTPRARDRTLVASGAFAGLVRRLDWLRRFHIDDRADPASPTTLVDRDGTARHGLDARLTALSRLPLLFPVVAPVLAGYRLRHRMRSSPKKASLRADPM